MSYNITHIVFSYLEMAYTPDSGIRVQDAKTVFVSVASNDVGRDLAWQFLQDNVIRITS